MELRSQVLLWELLLLQSECGAGEGPEWEHRRVFGSFHSGQSLRSELECRGVGHSHPAGKGLVWGASRE